MVIHLGVRHWPELGVFISVGIGTLCVYGAATPGAVTPGTAFPWCMER